ncbi:MAG: transglycosylase [Desulfobacteraceae bacterium 4572_35.1]|nr:MAG: transglycosylase [Desulfobacteraceae bacterium 4572_35.1]
MVASSEGVGRAEQFFIIWRVLSILLLLTVLISCAPSPPAPETPTLPLKLVSWDDLPGWTQDNHVAALRAFRASCRSLKKRPDWRDSCEVAQLEVDEKGARAFFQHHFRPWQLVNEDGSSDGLITGYYVPDLAGSRNSSTIFPYPIYKKPDDLLSIDLTSVYPELRGYRLRGRLVGQRVVPYFSREQIDSYEQPLHGQELFWVGDPVKLFFLQIQGSGRINLEDGTQVMVSYAEQNGHPYRSIGKLLLERGAMTRDQMSMQKIAAWGRNNPRKVQRLLNENPSYVFFRPLDAGVTTPPGAMGIPLTPQRSIAVDPRFIPLGAPVFLSTTFPGNEKPLQRLMVAQDTGGAIKGRVRADFFWGVGDEAGSYAGKMKQSGRMWVLLPKGINMPRK